MTNSTGSLTKEFHKLMKTISKLSDGQAKVSDWDDEDVAQFKVEIAPNGGPYSGGKFTFKVDLGYSFPECPPERIVCETQVYHPNIHSSDDSGETNICLNMFDSDEWMESFGIEDVIQGLLFLFYEPNIEDPLAQCFNSKISMEDYFQNVLLSLKGGVVEGVEYPWNYGSEKEKFEDTKVKSEIHEGNITAPKDGELDRTSKCLENNHQEVATDEATGHCPVRMAENPCIMNSVTLTGDMSSIKTEKQVTPQHQSDAFCFFPTTKEVNVPRNVSHEIRDNPPDVPMTTGTLGPCVPDITMTDMSNVVINHNDSMVGKLSFGNRSMTFHSFDTIMPKRNFAFTMLKSRSIPVAMETS